MSCIFSFILLLFLTPVTFSYQEWRTIYDRIMNEPEFSGYKNMIQGNKNVMLSLLYSGVTVFVPNNEAFRKYDGFFNDGFIMYHMGMEACTLGQLRLNNSIGSAFAENPPLWISVVTKNEGVDDDEYYVNNAKIVQRGSNYVAKCKRNENLKQVLHVIDRVLDPMLDAPFSTPSSYDFLENYQNWKLGSRKVSNFFKRIQFNEKEDLFKKQGGHTFFIPIDDKKHDHRLNNIDGYVIEGHVVPHQVLFTSPASKTTSYETAANGNYIYIVLTIKSHDGRYFVTSHTILGNSDHRRGEVVAEIVKANIPVTNGVVHLISQPLAVFDRELKPFPYLSVWYKINADPDLHITYEIGNQGRINKILRREKGLYTYFVPRNKSWKDYSGYDKDQLVDILGRHLIVSDTRYTMSKLATTAKNNGTILETLSGTLRVNVVYTNGTFCLIWGDRWIQVLRPDYECSDGIVHIIDGVFATPRAAVPIAKPKNTYFWKVLKNLVT